MPSHDLSHPCPDLRMALGRMTHALVRRRQSALWEKLEDCADAPTPCHIACAKAAYAMVGHGIAELAP